MLRPKAPCIQPFAGCAHILLLLPQGEKHLIEGLLPRIIAQADLGQPRAGEAKARAAQGAEQRHILIGVVQHAQHVHHIPHLGQVKILRVGVAVGRHALAGQNLGNQRRAAAGGAQQDHAIPIAQGALAVLIPDGMAHLLADQPRGQLRLVHPALARLARIVALLLRVRRGLLGIVVDDMQLHGRVARAFQPRVQGRVVVIGNLGSAAAHGAGKHAVDGSQDIAARTEIAAQQDAARNGLLFAAKLLIFAQKQRGIGQPEAINGLLDVTHHEQTVVFIVHAADDGLLDGRHILILIDKDRIVAIGHALPHLRVIQRLEGQMLQIAIIQQVFLLLVLRIARIHGLHQADQRAQGRQGGGHLGACLIDIGRHHGARLLGQLLHAVAQGGKAIGQRGVKIRVLGRACLDGKAQFARRQGILPQRIAQSGQQRLIGLRGGKQMHGRTGQLQQAQALIVQLLRALQAQQRFLAQDQQEGRKPGPGGIGHVLAQPRFRIGLRAQEGV